jgi:hypothetical protein
MRVWTERTLWRMSVFCETTAMSKAVIYTEMTWAALTTHIRLELKSWVTRLKTIWSIRSAWRCLWSAIF